MSVKFDRVFLSLTMGHDSICHRDLTWRLLSCIRIAWVSEWTEFFFQKSLLLYSRPARRLSDKRNPKCETMGVHTQGGGESGFFDEDAELLLLTGHDEPAIHQDRDRQEPAKDAGTGQHQATDPGILPFENDTLFHHSVYLLIY